MILLGCAIYYSTRSNEPTYEGRPLTEWLRKLDTDLNNFRTADINAPQLAGSVGPIRAIGTNAIPTLLNYVIAKPTPGVNALTRFVRKLGWKRFRFSVDDKQQLAIWGFWALGQDAKPAAPELVQIVYTGTGDSRGTALSCLSNFERDREIMLPVMLKLLSDSDKDMARYATNRLVSYFPEEAKNAGISKKQPSSKTPTTNSPTAHN